MTNNKPNINHTRFARKENKKRKKENDHEFTRQEEEEENKTMIHVGRKLSPNWGKFF